MKQKVKANIKFTTNSIGKVSYQSEYKENSSNWISMYPYSS